MKPHRRTLRRARTNYPQLAPGEVRLADRKECGTSIGLNVLTRNADNSVAVKQKPRTVLNGKFVLCRYPHLPSRSKYAPHLGEKQKEKLTARYIKAGADTGFANDFDPTGIVNVYPATP